MKSTRYAAYLAGAYVLLAGAYIILSGYLAAGASHTVEELRRIEAIKGVVYVAVTALLIFAGARWAMRRMEHDARELMRRDQALVANEGRVFAGLRAIDWVEHDVAFIAHRQAACFANRLIVDDLHDIGISRFTRCQ